MPVSAFSVRHCCAGPAAQPARAPRAAAQATLRSMADAPTPARGQITPGQQRQATSWPEGRMMSPAGGAAGVSSAVLPVLLKTAISLANELSNAVRRVPKARWGEW